MGKFWSGLHKFDEENAICHFLSANCSFLLFVLAIHAVHLPIFYPPKFSHIAMVFVSSVVKCMADEWWITIMRVHDICRSLGFRLNVFI